LRERAKATGHRSVVGVPLVVRGETVGALSLGDVARRRMTETEVRLLSAFADQAALALDNARMFAETTARLRETETLLEVARAFSSPLPVQEAMRHVTAAVARRFGADMAGAYFLDATRELLVPLAGYHVPTDLVSTLLQTPFPISRFKILREAWDTRKPVWTSAYESDHRFDQGFLADRRPRSLLFAPTPVRGEVVGGLFLVWWASERSFTPAELRLMEGVASQVGLALENADLDRQTQDKLRETELFAELAKTVNAALDLDTVLQRVAEAARELCGSDRAMIAIRDAASDAMIVRYRAGPRADAYRNRRVEPGQGVGGQVLLTGRPFRTGNYAEDPRVTKEYLQWAPEDATVAAVAVPIRIGDRIEGLLYAQNRSPRPFGDHHEAILVRLADHAAIAITNARLFAREQAARADAEAALLALRVTEERYRAVVDGSIQGMYIHQDRTIRFANEAMVRTFRYESAAELVGQDYLIFLAPEEHARIEGYRAARLRGEPAPTRYETRGRRKDGAPIWIEIVVSVVSWEGRPAILGTFLDITERKRAEATEREALALRSVTQLANAAAHEITTPCRSSWVTSRCSRGTSTCTRGPARGSRRPSAPQSACAPSWRAWLTSPGSGPRTTRRASPSGSISRSRPASPGTTRGRSRTARPASPRSSTGCATRWPSWNAGRPRRARRKGRGARTTRSSRRPSAFSILPVTGTLTYCFASAAYKTNVFPS